MEIKINSHTKVKFLMWGIENEQNAREQDEYTELSCTSRGLRVSLKQHQMRLLNVTVDQEGNAKA